MKLTDETKQKAKEIINLIKAQPADVLYALANFMDIEDVADEGMQSQGAYDAAEKADIYSTDGKPQKFIMRMGMALPDIDVTYNFETKDEGETWDIKDFEVAPHSNQTCEMVAVVKEGE